MDYLRKCTGRETGCFYSEHILNGTYLVHMRGGTNFPNFQEHSGDICIMPERQRHQRRRQQASTAHKFNKGEKLIV